MPFYETQTLRAQPGAWSGNPVFSYQWNRDGEPITILPLQFTAHPASVAVEEPQGAQFTATAVGDGAVTYQWEVSTNDGASWADVSGATASVLTVGPTAVSLDGYWYRCAATDSSGTIHSTHAVLSVSAAAATPISGDYPSGFTVPAGQTWQVTGEVTTGDNVVVHGTLKMRAGATLTFYGVDDTTMLGSPGAATAGYGEHDVVDEDTGVWVMNGGTLDAQGTPKTAWTRAAGDIAQSATVITLEEAPTGWQAGDTIVVAPTELPSTQAPEERTVVSVDGADVTIDEPLAFSHAGYEFYDATTLYAEVLNVTRDVKIRTIDPAESPGDPGGHAHLMFMNFLPVFMSHVELDRMGPNQGAAANEAKLVGRWAFHMHRTNLASWGSLIEGVVARRAGTHAFVVHFSHGVTLRDCIAYDSLNSGFWWDSGGNAFVQLDSTTDVLYDRCVAASLRAAYAHRHSLNGFDLYDVSLGVGSERCQMTNSVAFDIHGHTQGSGVKWQAPRWDVFDMVVHHCLRASYFWINASQRDLFIRTRAYHCKDFLKFGAYLNDSLVTDSFFESSENKAPLGLFALDRGINTGGLPQEHLRNVHRAVAGHPAFVVDHHRLEAIAPVYVRDCTFAPGAGAIAAIHVAGEPTNFHWVEFVDPVFDLPSGVPEFWVDSDVTANCRIIWRQTAGADVELRRFDHPTGVFNATYNAKVITL